MTYCINCPKAVNEPPLFSINPIWTKYLIIHFIILQNEINLLLLIYLFSYLTISHLYQNFPELFQFSNNNPQLNNSKINLGPIFLYKLNHILINLHLIHLSTPSKSQMNSKYPIYCFSFFLITTQLHF